MELKRRNRSKQERDIQLLIVPYGIETSIPPTKWMEIDGLLIVPYGIETQKRFKKLHKRKCF